jgi:hypothetical protein
MRAEELSGRQDRLCWPKKQPEKTKARAFDLASSSRAFDTQRL